MMMVHDLPESLAGDVTPHDGVSKEEKAKLELEAATTIAELSRNPEFLTLFLEYEEKQTLRSQICGDADQLECLVQNLEYLEKYPDKRESLEAFWPYAQAKIVTPAGKRMFEDLLQQKRLIEQRTRKKPIQPSFS